MSDLPKANKELGQHFLRDQKVISAITGDFQLQAGGLIEVGPGPAILTKALVAHGLPMHIIERDERFREQLEPLFSEEHLHFEDALKVHYEEFCLKNFPSAKNLWLVSNLPYNISAPLFVAFLKAPSLQFLTLMFQKEVGLKILNMPKDDDMGSLKVLGNVYFEVKKLLIVPPGAFAPPPKVDSIVLSFKRRQTPLHPLEDLPSLEKFLRLLFSQRRKQLGPVLKQAARPEEFLPILENLGIPKEVRAHTLDIQTILKLYREIKGLIK